MIITRIGSSFTTDLFPSEFSNQMYFSDDSCLDDYNYTSTFSVKYVISGFEEYVVEGRHKRINPGEFLLVDNRSEVSVVGAIGKGISLFIDPGTFAQVFASNLQTTERSMDSPDHVDFNDYHIYEEVYKSKEGRLQAFLGDLSSHLVTGKKGSDLDHDPDLFFSLSECLFKDQHEHSQRLGQITAKKKSTIQEQYARVLRGKEFLAENWNKPLQLSDVAMEASLSPYHFHRLFKKCFGVTPHAFHRQIQLDRAMEMLQSGSFSAGEVALRCGFTNQSSFGRAFTGYFGRKPSSIMK